MQTDPYMELLGIKTVAVEPGSAKLATTVKAEHLNIHGNCHGGFLYSLADAAFALASNSHGVPAVALSTNLQHFRPVRAGDALEAVATEENLGRRTATYRIEIRRGSELAALFTGTVFRMSEDRK